MKHLNNQPQRTMRRNNSSLDHLPKEQGKISSLLDNFGFIYCAQRPCDLFFHYSEYKGPVAQSQIGDEVEFYVGPSKTGDGKLAAFAVSKLDQGRSILWEKELGTRRGIIQTSVSRIVDNYKRDSLGLEGKIRLSKTAKQHQEKEGEVGEEEEEEEDNHDKEEALIDISYRMQDHQDSSLRLVPGDIVEFTLVQESRTGNYFARNIELILSKREQMEQEKERLLLETATLERGVVISLQNGFGFIRSNRRKEHVYFKYSHVVLPEDNDAEISISLTEGQDVEFLIVIDNTKKEGNSYSARQVKFLEKGTVPFEQLLGRNVIGTVVDISPSISKNRRAPAYQDIVGKVVLDTPISFVPTEQDHVNTPSLVAEVLLHARDTPGGVLVTMDPVNNISSWVRSGDKLMFDVVRDMVDSTCRAVPLTEHTEPGPGRIRLIAASSAGRSEGVVISIEDTFGIIQLADRNADVNFKVSDVFPRCIQEDMLFYLQNESIKDVAPLRVGCKVSFDLAPQAKPWNKKKKAEKQLRAQRILLLGFNDDIADPRLLKERTRLNLTVRKELEDLGVKIIAQSSMAKGPDGTKGFHLGWTSRISIISSDPGTVN